jgi:hypothetical protein
MAPRGIEAKRRKRHTRRCPMSRETLVRTVAICRFGPRSKCLAWRTLTCLRRDGRLLG